MHELTQGLADEVNAWRAREAPLLPLERRACLGGLQGALAGLDAARFVLAAVMKRLVRGKR